MIVRRNIISAVSLMALMAPGIALAQNTDDVVVMRRVLTPKAVGTPTPLPTDQGYEPVEGADTSKPYWVTSFWYSPSPDCSDSVEQTRLRGCVSNGKMVSESQCAEPAPEIKRYASNYQNCVFQWKTTPAGDWAEQCANTTRPVTAVCQRRDKTKITSVWDTTSDDLCAPLGEKPVQESGYNSEGCQGNGGTGSERYQWVSSDWSEWDSQCSATAKRNRTVKCFDNTKNENTASFYCKGDAPASTETSAIFANCGNVWAVGEWAVVEPRCGTEGAQTRSVTCTDEKTGALLPEEYCTTEKPAQTQNAVNYDSCTFDWTVSEWGEWDSFCSTSAKRKRSVQCKRSDNTSSDSTNCTSQKPAETETSSNLTGCAYRWNAGIWSDYITTANGCVKDNLSTRSVVCRRTDGQISEDALCTDPKPDSTRSYQDESDCSYSWQVKTSSDWSSTCSLQATQTRTYECVRGDGVVAGDEKCDASAKPSETVTQKVVSGCPYEWVKSEYTDWSSYCSATSTRTRSVSCRQILPDTTEVALNPSSCTGEKPVASETASIYSGCTGSWVPTSDWGWNGVIGATSSSCSAAPQQTRTLNCQMLDGSGNVVNLDPAQCGTKPETIRTADADYSACQYRWATSNWGWDGVDGAFSSTCSASAQQIRNAQCQRTADGQTWVEEKDTAKCGALADGTLRTQLNVTDCTGILEDGSFEANPTKWSLGNGTAISTSIPYDGTRHLRVGTGSGTAITSVNFVNGVTYSVTFYCRSRTTSQINRAMLLRTSTGTQYATINGICPTSYAKNTSDYVHTKSTGAYQISFPSGTSYDIDAILIVPK